MSVLIFVAFALLCTFGSPITPKSRTGRSLIAIATEGKATEVELWVEMVDNMNTKSQVVLFMLSYDKAINETICAGSKTICLFQPHSTWTSGRNALARSIAKYESEHRRRFKYWLFGDQDMAVLDNCGEATACQAPSYAPRSNELAACCFDTAMETLTSPEVQWAMVNFNLWGGGVIKDYLGFAHQDCCDGSLNAVHRRAVPVVLPYVELIDRKSWWEAQGLQFHVVSGCFPRYSVYSNAFSIKATTAHSPYPSGRTPDLVARALKQVYGKLGLIPDPISMRTVQLEQGNCANLDFDKLGLTEDGFEPRITNASFAAVSTSSGSVGRYKVGVRQRLPKTLWESDAWQNTTAFRRCSELLTPRYLAYIKTGELDKIDGKVY